MFACWPWLQVTYLELHTHKEQLMAGLLLKDMQEDGSQLHQRLKLELRFTTSRLEQTWFVCLLTVRLKVLETFLIGRVLTAHLQSSLRCV